MDQSFLDMLSSMMSTDDGASAPNLTGHHSPSTSPLQELIPVNFKDLTHGTQHKGRSIIVVVESITIHNGMTVAVRDADGSDGIVWSLITYPFPGGESSIQKGTIIAVKEPFYGKSVNGKIAVCVHHPTDLERVSKYDPLYTSLFDQHYEDENLLAAGTAAHQSGRYLDAVDIFSECLGRLPEDAPGEQVKSLLFHRAFAYKHVNAHDKVVQAAKEVLEYDPSHKRALTLLCASSLAVEDYDAAQQAAATLLSLTQTEGKRRPPIVKVVNTRVFQAKGIADLAALGKATTPDKLTHEISDFLGDVEVRNTATRGRGLFASKAISRGTVLLWEKPVAMCSDGQSSFQSGLKGLFGPSDPRYCNRISMSFVQHISDSTYGNPTRLAKLLDMFDGNPVQAQRSTNNKTLALDVYRIINIVTLNYHSLQPGSASISLDIQEPITETQLQKTMSLLSTSSAQKMHSRALYPMTSILNHSCHANTVYSHIGKIMVTSASRDIAKGEELTVEYIPTATPYHERKKQLSKYQIDCSCPICRIEASLSGTEKVLRQQYHTINQGLVRVARHSNGSASLQADLITGHKSLCHRWPTFKAEVNARLPCTTFATSIFLMAHAVLGPIRGWKNSTFLVVSKASRYFNLTLVYGSRLYLGWNGEVCLEHGEHARTGCNAILALVGLAELEYVCAKSHELAKNLLLCAKREYKLFFGEDGTFGNHFDDYSCMGLIPQLDSSDNVPNSATEKASVQDEMASMNALLKWMSQEYDAGVEFEKRNPYKDKREIVMLEA